MCGIAGIYRFDHRPVSSTTLERMKNATVHRGPDDEGVWADGEMGLAHNRLAILDLSPNGRQPMYDSEAGNRIVYNGEIYNFREIRKDLEAAGCRFRSACDTEVVLYAFRVWGAGCLGRFNGMFAFAIFNERTRELFLARDRLGIKPLYYYLDKKQLVFASETKSLLLADDVERRINKEALPELVAFRYLANGRTLFEDIHELRPGYHLTATPDGIRMHQYWEIPFDRAGGNDAATELDAFQARLDESVRLRLIADVPVGCALSGGVDSSLVTAVACDASTSTMKSFSVGFESEQFDERRYARAVADKLGIENHARVLNEKTFYQQIPRLTWHMDEPLNHPNSIGVWLLAQVARERVTVLLSGEGGDELLGGYSRYRNVLKLRHLSRVPGAAALSRLLPSQMSGKMGIISRELARDDDGRMIWSSAFIPSHLVDMLFGRGAAEEAEAHRRTILEAAPKDNLINRHLYLDLKTYLTSILIRVDKMCMAHSLENRVPLLDHTLVEHAFTMPQCLKVDRNRGKIALFELVSRRFNAELFDRPKVGFGVPAPFFQGDGLAYLRDLVTSRRFRERGLIEPDAVRRLLQVHESGRQMPADAFWILATLELWARTFIDRPGEIAA